MARELGLGVIPWSPLASGVLTGKYSRADLDAGEGTGAPTGTRKNVAAANGALTARSLDIADAVTKVATEIGTTPSRAALAWTLRNPGVTSPIKGVRTLAQLEDNLGALDVEFSAEQLATLDAASAVDLGFPHEFLRRPMTRTVMFGNTTIEPRFAENGTI
jgi:aryl-alcohol dehydrogenase-like predicted oxidoreductase